MSLRSKLILAFMAIVSLLLFVGVTSVYINHRIQTDVADLRSSRGVDLRHVDIDNTSLEIEGFWHPSGSFVATDVAMMPGRRHPKLRGEIQAVDASQHSITLYGVPIRVSEETEFIDADGLRFEDLRPGQRIEVSSHIADARWTARKIKTRNVKKSDQIKGTATNAELDGKAPETVEFHGIVISLALPSNDSPNGVLRRIELATQMTLLLQECRAAAHELVGRTRVWHGLEGAPEPERDTPAPTAAHARLIRGERDFEYYLEQSYGGDGDVALPSNPSAFAPWLRSLSDRLPTFRAHVETLQDLAGTDPDRARSFLDDVYDPFLQNDLLPIVYAYRAEAEESLADQLHGISSRNNTTMRVALVTSGVAVILAVVLGMSLWRSIHAPIRALHAAALRLGQGHLETRVDVRSGDELGVLADAFNKMAEELGRTTVSVGNLENVFDSMAGALLIFDPDGRITRVNQAARDLLGYDRDALLGRPFDEICPTLRADPRGPIVQTNDEGIVAIEEKVFLRRDTSRVPVSFSGAELRSADGPLQGYVCVAQDLTERKRIEERIQSSLTEKELLLREVHHRVKNNMQVISSLLALQSSYTNDPKIRAQFEESQNRIRSMALIHEQLYQTSDFTELDLRAYLELLTAHLMRSSDCSERIHLDLHVEALASDIDQAVACGLIVNELVTNSLKHAFPAGVRGRIRVLLYEDAAGNRILSVSDNGRGLCENRDVEKSHGLGLTLVEKLVKQFRGRLDISSDKGTEVRIVFPSDRSPQALAS